MRFCKIAVLLLLFQCLWFSYAAAEEDKYARQGDLALSEGKYFEAIDFFWMSVRRDPSSPYAFYRLAVAYDSLGMREEANNMKERAQALEKHNQWLLKGKDQYAKKDYVEAFKSFQHALDYFPDSPVAYQALGELYEAMGQAENAKKSYETALELIKKNKIKVDPNISKSPPDEKIEDIMDYWDTRRKLEKRRRDLSEKFGFSVRLKDPISHTNNNLFNALVYTPVHEGANTIKEGTYCLESGFEFASGKTSSDSQSWQVRYNARLFEPYFSLTYGVTETFEVRGYLSLPTLKDSGTTGIIVDEGTTEYIANEKRGWGIGDLIPSLKYNFYRGGDGFTAFSFVLGAKIPFAKKENFVSSGGVDLGVNFLASFKYGEFYNHISVGFSSVGAEGIFEENLSLGAVMAVSASSSYHYYDNATAHIQLNVLSNAFDEINGYDGMIMDVFGGTKIQFESLLIDFGAGIGLSEPAADFFVKMSVTTMF